MVCDMWIRIALILSSAISKRSTVHRPRTTCLGSNQQTNAYESLHLFKNSTLLKLCHSQRLLGGYIPVGNPDGVATLGKTRSRVTAKRLHVTTQSSRAVLIQKLAVNTESYRSNSLVLVGGTDSSLVSTKAVFDTIPRFWRVMIDSPGT